MSIEDIAVVRSGSGNPYLSRKSLIGEERVRQLGLFLRGFPTPGYDFWLVKSSGEARQLRSVEETNVDPTVVDYYWTVDGKERKRK